MCIYGKNEVIAKNDKHDIFAVIMRCDNRDDVNCVC